jgi:hypothetical protein
VASATAGATLGRSRPIADACGAPVLRGQGPIGRPGTTRPILASTTCMPCSFAVLRRPRSQLGAQPTTLAE